MSKNDWEICQEYDIIVDSSEIIRFFFLFLGGFLLWFFLYNFLNFFDYIVFDLFHTFNDLFAYIFLDYYQALSDFEVVFVVLIEKWEGIWIIEFLF